MSKVSEKKSTDDGIFCKWEYTKDIVGIISLFIFPGHLLNHLINLGLKSNLVFQIAWKFLIPSMENVYDKIFSGNQVFGHCDIDLWTYVPIKLHMTLILCLQGIPTNQK